MIKAQKITIQDNAIELVKSGLRLKKNILLSNYSDYKNRLKKFEMRFKMSTPQFLKKFNSGKLGDAQKWFDWVYTYEAYSEISNQLRLLKEIKI